MNDKSYWKEYYRKNPNPVAPSTFAKFIEGFVEPEKTIIELGCGNGRDSVFFAQKQLKVTAIDQISEEMNYLNNKYGLYNLEFKADDFTRLSTDKKYDYIYSRFTLHSINEEAEARVFKWISQQLEDDGLFFLEVRSINDPMFKQGEKISETENITTHYRRYLDYNQTIKKLENHGLDVVYKLESRGLAKYKDDDPMLIRLVMQKK